MRSIKSASYIYQRCLKFNKHDTKIIYLCLSVSSNNWFSSVTQTCPTLCNPMNRSMPGLPVHHQQSESTQTHVHCASDAIQPSHLLSSPSPPALKLSEHQGLFKWVSSLPQVAKVLELQLWHQSFQNIQDWFPLGLTDLISLLSNRLSRVFFNTTIWRHRFFCSQPSPRVCPSPKWLVACRRGQTSEHRHTERGQGMETHT